MTTYDKLIASDLAGLATDNRRGTATLDDVLQAIARGPVAEPRTLDVVALAQIFALRVARGAAGAAALIITLGLWRMLYRPDVRRYQSWPSGDDWTLELMRSDTVTMVLAMVLVVTASYAIAGQVARWWFARRSGQGADLSRLVQRVDRVALALVLAGVPALVTLTGVVAVSVGHERWIAMMRGNDNDAYNIWPALVATLRLAARTRDTHNIGFGFGTALLERLRVVAFATGGITAVAAVIAATVRRRVVQGHGGAALVVPATIYGDRAARLAGGAVAGLGAVVALIAWHLPMRGDDVNRALYWWSSDRTRLATTLVIAILVARQLARHVAARRFAHHAVGPEARARARQLASGLDAWSISLGAGGAAAVATMFAMASLAVGRDFGVFVEPHGPRLAHVVWLALHAITPTVPLAFAIGGGVARAAACSTRRRLRLVCVLESRDGLIMASAFTVVSALAITVLDLGTGDVSAPAHALPDGLQLGISLGVAISVLLFATSLVLRRRKRELALL